MRHDRIDDDLPGFNPQAKQLRNNQTDKNARPAGVYPPSAPERELASLDFIVTFISLITVAEGNIGAAVIAIRLADIPAGDNVPVSHRDGLAERFHEGIRPASKGLGFRIAEVLMHVHQADLAAKEGAAFRPLEHGLDTSVILQRSVHQARAVRAFQMLFNKIL